MSSFSALLYSILTVLTHLKNVMEAETVSDEDKEDTDVERKRFKIEKNNIMYVQESGSYKQSSSRLFVYHINRTVRCDT